MIRLLLWAPAFVTSTLSGNHRRMVTNIKSLPSPIEVVINGQSCTLVTVGCVAKTLGRSVWTVHHWTRIGLFPPTPFFWDPSETRTRFRLYPQPFVESLEAITEQGYLGRRLNRESWARFHDDVFRAYHQTVTPLFSPIG
jgi:hypothetical protein